MSLSVTGIFSSIGHFLAKAVSVFLMADTKIQQVTAEVQAAAPGVEAVSALVPVYGPAAVSIEQAGVMALGAIAGVFHVLGAAAEAKLMNVGLDQTAIQTAIDVYNKLPAEVLKMVTPAPVAVGKPVPPAQPAA